MRNDEQNWRITHQVLASSTIQNDSVHIENIRDFRFPTRNEDAPQKHLIDREFPISLIETSWIAIIPFRPHFAHLITSFGLTDGTYIAISIEIRYPEGEPYTLWKTFVPHYWLSYVIATEDDVFRIRTDVRVNEPVHLYRLMFTPEESQKLFGDMVTRAQVVNHTKPERFNSAMNSCTSNVLRHLKHATNRPLPYSRSHYFTDRLDPYLAQHGYLSLEDRYSSLIRTKHCIDDTVRAIPIDAPDFSMRIRENLSLGTV
jgi:hypothetical protein